MISVHFGQLDMVWCKTSKRGQKSNRWAVMVADHWPPISSSASTVFPTD